MNGCWVMSLYLLLTSCANLCNKGNFLMNNFWFYLLLFYFSLFFFFSSLVLVFLFINLPLGRAMRSSFLYIYFYNIFRKEQAKISLHQIRCTTLSFVFMRYCKCRVWVIKQTTAKNIKSNIIYCTKLKWFGSCCASAF